MLNFITFWGRTQLHSTLKIFWEVKSQNDKYVKCRPCDDLQVDNKIFTSRHQNHFLSSKELNPPPSVAGFGHAFFNLKSFWIVFGTPKDFSQTFRVRTSKQFLWKSFTSPNFKRLYSAYKGLWKTIKSDKKNRKTIKIFLNFHFTRKWTRTI